MLGRGQHTQASDGTSAHRSDRIGTASAEDVGAISRRDLPHRLDGRQPLCLIAVSDRRLECECTLYSGEPADLVQRYEPERAGSG